MSLSSGDFSRGMRRGVAWSLFWVSVLCVMPVRAQKSSGDILGTVTDPSGAPVAGTNITLTSDSTGEVRQEKTDGLGNYRFAFVPPGTYSARAEKSGFTTVAVKGLILTVDADMRQDIALKVGTLTDAITVTANAVQVNAESPSLGNVIQEHTIVALPLNGRSFLELAELGAGAVNVAVSGIESNATGTGGGRPGMAVSIAGIREGSNDILFDGIPSKNDYQNMIGIQPTPDGLAEFKIQQGYFSAEYGLPVVINVVTKSGTNAIHGAAWEFLRNDKLDARRTFEIRKGPLRHNQFGAAGGGPVIKNKIFWFADYEGQQIRQLLGSARAIVPTPAMLGGDFSSLSTQIVDPFTGQPFPNNSIPANRMSGFAQKYKQFIPAPTTVRDGVFNAVGSSKVTEKDAKFDARGDWNISTSDRVFGRFSYDNSSIFNRSILPFAGTDFPLNARNLSIGWTHVFTPHLLNEARFGLDRVFMQNGTPENSVSNPNFPTLLGLKNLNSVGVCNGLPGVAMGGFSTFGGNDSCEVPLNNNFHYVDSISYDRGRHHITAGGQIIQVQKRDTVSFGSLGSFNFTGQFTGNAAADFVLGVPFTATGAQTAPPMERRGIWWDVFANDDFKITRNFTVNFGVRYQYTQPLTELHNNISIFDPTTGSIKVAGKGGASLGLLTPDRNDFAPRLGFAWAPAGSRKWSVRSSYGIFYDRLPGNEWAWQGISAPFIVSQSLTSDPRTPTIDMANLFPSIDISNPNSFRNIALFNLADRRDPYIQQWTFSLQRSFAGSLFAEAAYIGSKGTKLSKRVDLNVAPLPAINDTRPLAARRPYPQYSYILDDLGIASSHYHGLQLNLRKSYSNGLAFQTGYTWAKSLDNDSYDSKASRNYQLGDLDKGRSIFDIRHRFVYSMTYALPFGRDLRGAARQVVAGWNINTIVQIQTGSPFGVTTSQDPSDTGARFNRRPNRLCDGNLPPGRRTADMWFDKSCFALPPFRTYGNAGAQILDGPSFKSVDLSLDKQFPIFRESKRLEFRTEVFNLLNHANLGKPTSNIESAAVGQIRSSGTGRVIQFGLKFLF